MTFTQLALLARTAAYLQPGQPVHRARLRAQRAALHRWPTAGRRLLAGRPWTVGDAGWPGRFQPVDAVTAQSLPSSARLRSGRMMLLGVARDLGDPPDWRQSEAPLLWRFHLHYWEWAWALAVEPDLALARRVFAQLWRSWLDASPFGRGDAWFPYPAALRAWAWCGLHGRLVAGTGLESGFVAELAAHAGFLRRHLESDVGGNHLIKNLKALIGVAVFFADERLLQRALRRLTRQVAVQVLTDGGHYERAPAYHCQVLADLVDVDSLVRAAGAIPPAPIGDAITRMRRWLGAALTPVGDVPLLNDGYPVNRRLVAALRPDPPPPHPLLTLPDTGLARATVGGWHLLTDVGAPCPDELPGHAHADSLSCLVYVDGAPLLVDTGTSTYDNGPRRDYERSTAAHNTLEVDGANSTEVWGAFRAARRARVFDFDAGADSAGVTVEAAHDGYRRLPGSPIHRRRWFLDDCGMQVEDLVTGRGRHTVAIRWHLAPESVLRLGPGEAAVTTPAGAFHVGVTSVVRTQLRCESGLVALGFGRTVRAPVLTCRLEAELPVRVTTRWRRGQQGGGRIA